MWCIFFAEAESNENPNPKEVRQGTVNIATFVFAQTFEIQTEPDPAKLTPLIVINCNIAAGLAAAQLPTRSPRAGIL
jgi:flagellar protein FlaF